MYNEEILSSMPFIVFNIKLFAFCEITLIFSLLSAKFMKIHKYGMIHHPIEITCAIVIY